MNQAFFDLPFAAYKLAAAISLLVNTNRELACDDCDRHRPFL